MNDRRRGSGFNRNVASHRAARQARHDAPAPARRRRSSVPKFLAIAVVVAFGSPLAIQSFGLADLRIARTAEAQSTTDRLEGRATVIDGDTVAIEGVSERIRLYGIDAPESGQTCDDANGRRYLCGTRSAEYLAGLVGRSGRLQCFVEDVDRYGRYVAECATPGNVVVNAEMVRAGWAVEYTQYSDGRYDQEESEAQSAGRGMWAGEFVQPWDWRRGDRLATETAAVVDEQGAPSTGCVIKGNINREGERIYHTPRSQSYERTRIDEGAGERWFCSEAEARAAGWRAPRG